MNQSAARGDIVNDVIYVNLEFKPVIYPGIMKNRYIISEYGHVVEFGNHLRTPFINSYGYLQIRMVNENGVIWHPSIARLVAYEFCLNNRDINLSVDHKDCNKRNNHYTNLEWVDIKENLRRAYINRLMSNYDSYKTDEQIITVCRLLQDTDLPYSKICELAGINNLRDNQCKGLCCDILDGKYWTRISCNFDFSNRIRRRTISNTDKVYLRSLIGKLSTSEIYEHYYYYNLKWENADRKERDNFRHILLRITQGSSTIPEMGVGSSDSKHQFDK